MADIAKEAQTWLMNINVNKTDVDLDEIRQIAIDYIMALKE